MTHTTTDAAEARALKVQEIDRIATLLLNEWKRVDPSSGVALHPASYIANFADMARVVIADRTTIAEASEARAREVLISQICADSPTLFPNGVREAVEKDMAAVMLRPSRVIAAMLAFATAEAASGAGEREGLAWRLERISDDGGPLTLSDKAVLREARAALASLPPATDPAMVTVPRAKLEAIKGAGRYAPVGDGYFDPYGSVSEAVDAAVNAALAAAPTIPATGEAIPEGMKPWHGGDAAPNDLDLSGRVLREDGQTEAGRDVTIQQWKRPVPRCKWNIIAYTPKPTIPATGHAATVDPDDLRPWGYAPGGYVFRCRDCPADPPFEQRPLGDKRSWRCKPHAEAARDASGHAATEGEGA